ncbi:hypothetical protein CBR_g36390 [Chara braunii]|uniref:DM10 domain-containing protein n=1 Tax=Chara braunii TaxID=69332 RepID=A0A388LKM5_CHABU|nr:hypothetical protein CBR_g36390 [Chara braunii]|eukprot:GBG82864.1 hypothetical protein CBR_g36390 [Chara braunii]
MASDGERYAFVAHWLDPHSSIIWKYQLMFFTADNSIAMYDIKNKRSFLKRTPYPSIRPEDLYIGATVTVYSRQLKVVGYDDEYTKKRLEHIQMTFALIKPDGVEKFGELLTEIYKHGFVLKRLKMCTMSPSEAREFYKPHSQEPIFEEMVLALCSGEVIGMEIIGDDATARWLKLIGPRDPGIANLEAPNSLRARFGRDKINNALYGADSKEDMERLRTLFFETPGFGKCPALQKDSTLCIIKPHAVLAGIAGEIIQHIMQSFNISGMESFNISHVDAAEFCEVYRGVVPEYTLMVQELSSGPLIGIVVSGVKNPVASSDCEGTTEAPPKTIVGIFRDFCGPADSEIAKIVRPKTLRAMFGIDKVKNAVHCTDLDEDGLLECQFFFKTHPKK